MAARSRSALLALCFFLLSLLSTITTASPVDLSNLEARDGKNGNNVKRQESSVTLAPARGPALSSMMTTSRLAPVRPPPSSSSSPSALLPVRPTSVSSSSTTSRRTSTSSRSSTSTRSSSTTRSSPTTASATATRTSTTSRSSTSSSSSAAPSGTAPSSAFASNILQAHNSARSSHGARALTWSSNAESLARTWAEQCVWQHGGAPNLGQNLAASAGYRQTGQQAVNGWMSEESDYDPSNPTYSHFTQVVWKATTQVGCYQATCDRLVNPDGSEVFPGYSPSYYIVCNYSPPGNVAGQFNENVQKNE
ncbi:PR-1-like protein [Cystobasidium minutum MCA 4210]|uniref:PR-1-like protein n=1 Tax=Cystobasidium minutum MCA 4210 TaxID=1397322 RepID=UPI0034CDD3B7|eukprot:jgi/Rhomi1/149472/estExt_Genewise1.C_2_t10113